MEDAECSSRSKNRFDFFLKLAKSASGVEAYRILKGVFWEVVKVNYCSWPDVKEVLQHRSEHCTPRISILSIAGCHSFLNRLKSCY